MYYGKLGSAQSVSSILPVAPIDKVLTSPEWLTLKGPAPQWLCSLWASVLWATIPTPTPTAPYVACLSSLVTLLCGQDWKGGPRF